MLRALAFIGHTEIIIVVGVIILLFGAAKIPALMRSMGSGISQFKKGIKEGEKEAVEESKEEEKKSEGSESK